MERRDTYAYGGQRSVASRAEQQFHFAYVTDRNSIIEQILQFYTFVACAN